MLVVHLCRSLEKAGVQVENAIIVNYGYAESSILHHLLSRVSFTPRGTSKQQRHLTVCHGLLGQIIVDDESMFSRISEPLGNRTACETSIVS